MSFDPWRSAAVTVDVLAAQYATPAALERRRQLRLTALFDAARHGSALYRRRLPPGVALQDVQPVTKGELMQRFGDWVTNPQLCLTDVQRFIAAPSRIGEDFQGRYLVWQSSGSSGEPGVFVQDDAALTVYDALEACRRPQWLSAACLGDRIAFVGAIGGHFASTVSIERLRRLNPFARRQIRSFSFLQPLQELAEQLQRFAPTVLATYPTAAVALAELHRAGRLQLRLREVWAGGETLTQGMQRCIALAFGCGIVNSYGASEFLPLACTCSHGALHLNSDWALLEPVDEHWRPVPPGTPGHTVLLTNLANHVQPLIRYDLGDRVVLLPDRCPCGSALPCLEVQGRQDDALMMRDAQRRPVPLLPLALTTVLEDDAEVYDFLLVQEDEDTLSLTLGAGSIERARRALRAYLQRQGLAAAHLHVRHGATGRPAHSGKRQRIVQAARR